MDQETRGKLIRNFGGSGKPFWRMLRALDMLDNLKTLPTLDLAICISHLFKAAGVDDLKALARKYFDDPDQIYRDFPPLLINHPWLWR